MSNNQNNNEESVCVGEIIENNHHPHNNNNQNDAYSYQHSHQMMHSNPYSQTLPSPNQNNNNQQQQQQHNFTTTGTTVDNRTGQVIHHHHQQQQQQYFQQPQHHHHQHQQQQQHVVYATNPQTGETVSFPVVPAMLNPPIHHRGSPTYEYHGGSAGNIIPHQHQHQHQHRQSAFAVANGEVDSSSTAAPWSTGLFDCSDDSEGCLEAWCCGRCQVSRQYGFVNNGVKDIDLFAFFFSVVVDALAAPAGLLALSWYTRRSIRQRYAIEGSDCSDFCTAFCCTPCAIHQQYREMSIQGEWPTGCCIKNVYALPASARVRRMEVDGEQQNRQPQALQQIHQGELINNNINNGEVETSMV